MQNFWELKIGFEFVIIRNKNKMFKPTAFYIWIKVQIVDPLFIVSLHLEARTAKL